MRKLWLTLGIILFISIGYFAYLNRAQYVDFIYFPHKTFFNINFGIIIVATALYSGFSVFLMSLSTIMELNERVKRHMRNAERASVENEESADKVKNLEAKIDTLEMALKDALSK